MSSPTGSLRPSCTFVSGKRVSGGLERSRLATSISSCRFCRIPARQAIFAENSGLKPTYVAPLLASLNASPCFVRLREIREALLPDPAAQNETPVVAAPSASPLRSIETTSATPCEPHDPAGVRAAE